MVPIPVVLAEHVLKQFAELRLKQKRNWKYLNCIN